MENKLTHLDDQGRATMVDVGDKAVTQRRAVARGRVTMQSATLAQIEAGNMKKGDVLTIAQLAGIQAAKQTSNLIPLCHPLMLNKVSVTCAINSAESCVDIEATAKVSGKTGVEMEALTAVSTATLTVYDMVKAVQKDMEIGGIRVTLKDGGKSGRFENP